MAVMIDTGKEKFPLKRGYFAIVEDGSLRETIYGRARAKERFKELYPELNAISMLINSYGNCYGVKF